MTTTTSTPSAAPTTPARSFDPALVAAVRLVRTSWHSANPKLAEGKRAPAASVGDHAAVRARITSMVNGPVTPDKVLALTGLTFPKLVAVASFDPECGDDLAKIRTLGKEFAKDANKSWRTGRYLAGIVAAWVVEMRASAKPAKKPAKKSA